MIWVEFPKRLGTALKALCVLAEAEQPMLSRDIAGKIDVTRAETAKVLQLLVWGGFVKSRRGSKGGFQLAMPASRITTGAVIRFFATRHSQEHDSTSAIMKLWRKTGGPCQTAFARLTLAQVAAGGRRTVREKRNTRKSPSQMTSEE